MQTQIFSQYLKLCAYQYDAVTESISWIFFSLYIFIVLFHNIFLQKMQNKGFI